MKTAILADIDWGIILLIIIVASITYLILSLSFSSWIWYGQLLAPMLGIIIYNVLILLRGDKG